MLSILTEIYDRTGNALIVAWMFSALSKYCAQLKTAVVLEQIGTKSAAGLASCNSTAAALLNNGVLDQPPREFIAVSKNHSKLEYFS